MSGNEKIRQADLASLKVVVYPDPRLRQQCEEVEDPTDPAVRALVERMFEIMFEAKGVGLAAAQVGIGACLFVSSPSFDPGDRRVYINPQIISADGSQDSEEGCLSFPGIFSKIKRHNEVTVRAYDLDGQQFEESGTELLARIIEHEIDHISGRLLVDRMGSVGKLANRRALKALEKEFSGA